MKNLFTSAIEEQVSLYLKVVEDLSSLDSSRDTR